MKASAVLPFLLSRTTGQTPTRLRDKYHFTDKDFSRVWDTVVIGSGVGAIGAYDRRTKGDSVLIIDPSFSSGTKSVPRGLTDVRLFRLPPSMTRFLPQRFGNGPFIVRHENGEFVLRGVNPSGGGGASGRSVWAAVLEPLSPASMNFWHPRDTRSPRGVDLEEMLRPYFGRVAATIGAQVNRYHSPATYLADAAFADSDTVRVRRPLLSIIQADEKKGQKPGDIIADPLADGLLGSRATCNACGNCMTGCPTDSKTGMDVYNRLAEWAGVQQRRGMVRRISQNPDGTYMLDIVDPRHPRGKVIGLVRVKKLILAAGAGTTENGTIDLLLKMQEDGFLSPTLPVGHGVISNHEEFFGITGVRPEKFMPPGTKNHDMTTGVAIPLVLETKNGDANARLEIVNFGSRLFDPLRFIIGPLDPMRLGWNYKTIKVLCGVIRNILQSCVDPQWSKRKLILMTMGEDGESRITRNAEGRLVRIPVAPGHTDHRAVVLAMAKTLADASGGQLHGTLANLFILKKRGNTPLTVTAHIAGGAPMGNDMKRSVVDAYGRLWGHPNIQVCGAPVVPINTTTGKVTSPATNPTGGYAQWAAFFTDMTPGKGWPDLRTSQRELARGIPPWLGSARGQRMAHPALSRSA